MGTHLTHEKPFCKSNQGMDVPMLTAQGGLATAMGGSRCISAVLYALVLCEEEPGGECDNSKQGGK